LVLRASLHNEPEEAPGIAIPPSVPYEGELSSMLPFCDYKKSFGIAGKKKKFFLSPSPFF